MAQAPESKLLVSALKRCLKLKSVTYKNLALSMNLSESSVKRWFASNNLSLQRFEQVCAVSRGLKNISGRQLSAGSVS
jgi:hypothetical protein